MSQTPPPVLDSEQAYMEAMYSEEEKQKILQDIDQAATSTRLTGASAAWDAYKPRKRGVLFPLVINVCAAAIIVGGWFAADAWFKTKQQVLSLKTDQLFSTEGTLLAKVLEESKAQLDAKNQEIQKIQSNLAQLTLEKNALVKTFNDQVAAKEKELRSSLELELDAERQRLLAQGLSEAAIAQRLKEFEALKNAEFSKTLSDFRAQAQAQIDQRTKELGDMQAKLQAATAEQDRLKAQIDRNSQEQATALDKLQRERDELNLFFRQSDALFQAIHDAISAGDFQQAQTAVDNLNGLLVQAVKSNTDAVRQRAEVQEVTSSSLQTALDLLKNGGADPRFEAFKAQVSKAQKAASLEERSTLVSKAVQSVPEISKAFQILQAWQNQRELAAIEEKLAQANALTAAQGPEAALILLHSAVSNVALREGIDAAWKAYKDKVIQEEAELAALRKDKSDLTDKAAALQKKIDELLPYQTKWNNLAALYAQNKDAAFLALQNPIKSGYEAAKKDFLITFASEDALTLFPDFDKALANFGDSAGLIDPRPIREKALDDVLSFTTYLAGNSGDAKNAQDNADRLSQQDGKYREVVASIQTLLHKGAVETPIDTSSTVFLGSLVSLDGNIAVVEPLTKADVATGQTIEVHHRRGTADAVVARGVITSVSASRIGARVNPEQGAAFQPSSGDGVYLVR